MALGYLQRAFKIIISVAVLGLIISIVYLHHLPSSAFFSLNQIVHPQRDEFVKDYLITDIEADYKSSQLLSTEDNSTEETSILVPSTEETSIPSTEETSIPSTEELSTENEIMDILKKSVGDGSKDAFSNLQHNGTNLADVGIKALAEDTKTIDRIKVNPVHVLLLTEGRSGSTWLSSFFWHRPEVYYVYEPLYPTKQWKSAGCSDSEETKKSCESEILGNFWRCDFESSELTILGRYPNYNNQCKGCTMKGKEERCHGSRHRVAKTINLFDLNNIENLVKDVENYDIRVIQLVRDPRPLLRSRSRGGFGSIDGIHKLNDKSESREKQYETVCKRMLNNAKLGDSSPEWLKNRYVRITHKQLSLQPLETAKMLYKFVELEWTKETELYIHNTTQGKIGKSYMFGIGKVSTDVLNNWKTMPDDMIDSITESCYETLQYLGYETDLNVIKQWKSEDA